MFTNKKVIVGLTGSVASVKGLSLCLALRHCGFQVRVAMTRSASKFVTPLTLSAVSTERAYTDLWEMQDAQAGEVHMEWASWAEAIVIAPCTASCLADLSHGLYNNPVTLLASNMKCNRWFIAPAMSQNMWEQPAVIENVSRIKSWGATFLGPKGGSVASGGQGQRMLEPNEIATYLNAITSEKGE